MPDHVLSSAEVRRRLFAGHHVQLTRRQGQVLWLRHHAFEDTEIALLLGREVYTVRNHLHAARCLVIPPSLSLTSVNAVIWAALHENCCLAGVSSAFGIRPAPHRTTNNLVVHNQVNRPEIRQSCILEVDQ